MLVCLPILLLSYKCIEKPMGCLFAKFWKKIAGKWSFWAFFSKKIADVVIFVCYFLPTQLWLRIQLILILSVDFFRKFRTIFSKMVFLLFQRRPLIAEVGNLSALPSKPAFFSGIETFGVKIHALLPWTTAWKRSTSGGSAERQRVPMFGFIFRRWSKNRLSNRFRSFFDFLLFSQFLRKKSNSFGQNPKSQKWLFRQSGSSQFSWWDINWFLWFRKHWAFLVLDFFPDFDE